MLLAVERAYLRILFTCGAVQYASWEFVGETAPLALLLGLQSSIDYMQGLSLVRCLDHLFMHSGLLLQAALLEADLCCTIDIIVHHFPALKFMCCCSFVACASTSSLIHLQWHWLVGNAQQQLYYFLGSPGFYALGRAVWRFGSQLKGQS